MTMQFATTEQIAQWDDIILKNPNGGNIFQGYEFARQKEQGGWIPRFIMADALGVSVLEKRFLGHKLWYIPKGPDVNAARALTNLLPALRDFAKKNNVFAIKIEPELLKTAETQADLLKMGLKQAKSIQPSSTVILDISGEFDDILMRLNQKGRHALRRAERDGVTVEKVAATEENCKKMFNLLTETAKGAFPIRSYSYYKTFWQRYEKAGQGQLFFAFFENQLVAGAYALVFGNKSVYKDGASVRERPAYGASHLLQWHVIQWVKQRGSRVHDLCGVPPSDQIKNPEHPFYGLGRFKTSFNKEVTDYVGVYDLPVNGFVYSLWNAFGERVVRRLYYQRYHENYY